MKRDICKRKKLNYKSSECNTRFDDTYRLYKYNIGIDYHHIRNRNEERHIKRKKLSNESGDFIAKFYDTYILYKYNIGIDYHHIRNRNEERHM